MEVPQVAMPTFFPPGCPRSPTAPPALEAGTDPPRLHALESRDWFAANGFALERHEPDHAPHFWLLTARNGGRYGPLEEETLEDLWDAFECLACDCLIASVAAGRLLDRHVRGSDRFREELEAWASGMRRTRILRVAISMFTEVAQQLHETPADWMEQFERLPRDADGGVLYGIAPYVRVGLTEARRKRLDQATRCADGVRCVQRL